MSEMESAEEYEEIEETLVMAELQGIMETDFLSQMRQAKVLNIGSDNPLFQFDDYTFSGEYQDTMGTCMFFEEVKADKPYESTEDYSDDNNDAKEVKKLEYRCLTNKKICLERIFLNTMEAETPTGETDGESAEGVSKVATTEKSKDQEEPSTSGEHTTAKT